jgi:hypothetical protein
MLWESHVADRRSRNRSQQTLAAGRFQRIRVKALTAKSVQPRSEPSSPRLTNLLHVRMLQSLTRMIFAAHILLVSGQRMLITGKL